MSRIVTISSDQDVVGLRWMRLHSIGETRAHIGVEECGGILKLTGDHLSFVLTIE
jgi:hypothetical protein